VQRSKNGKRNFDRYKRRNKTEAVMTQDAVKISGVTKVGVTCCGN